MGDFRTTTGESSPLPPQERRRRRWMGVLMVLALVAGVGAIGALIHVDRYFLADGYVTTEAYAEVRPSTVGIVASIEAQTASVVTQGQLMVQLDAGEEQAAVEEARSQVHKMEADRSRRQAEISEERRRLQESISMARLRLQNAASKLARAKELLERGLLAGSALEDSRLSQELAQAELDSLVKTDASVYEKELAALDQELSARQDAMARAQARLRMKQVRAPVGGQVLRSEFVVGELVRPDNVLFEVFGGERQVLKLRIPERHATRLAVGQRYSARLLSYGGLKAVWFTGHVSSLRNVIQSEGQRTYRAAYCDFDAGGRTVPPGTTAEARIYYGRSNLWMLLLDLY